MTVDRRPFGLTTSQVNRAVGQLESRLLQAESEQAREVALARGDREAANLAGLEAVIAGQHEGYDRNDSWGSPGPPPLESQVQLREIFRLGLARHATGLGPGVRRRTPRSRGAAHRPAARTTTATRDGPGDSDPHLGESDPELRRAR
jgi:hypothetical protein